MNKFGVFSLQRIVAKHSERFENPGTDEAMVLTQAINNPCDIKGNLYERI
jgi:hypothetical protein